MPEIYPVVLLAEQAFTATDAQQVRSLHAELTDEDIAVEYHLLIPVDDAAGRVEAAMSSLGTGEVLVVPSAVLGDDEIEAARSEALSECRNAVTESLAQLKAAGATASGESILDDPIDVLVAKVAEYDAREVIIYTRPHLVAEFFHRDWTSRARKKLGVPVLHLIEHETFDEQAGGGEGISGF